MHMHNGVQIIMGQMPVGQACPGYVDLLKAVTGRIRVGAAARCGTPHECTVTGFTRHVPDRAFPEGFRADFKHTFL